MIVTVDAVLLTLHEQVLKVVLHTRPKGAKEPFPGMLALPGGYVHEDSDEDTNETVVRTLLRKTGIVSPYLEQLYTFTGRERDPRDWSCSIAYYALVNCDELLESAKGVELYPVDDLPKLAFDHNKIVDYAVSRVRNKSNYSPLPCFLLPKQFTLTELQRTYELVLQKKEQKPNFRRKMQDEWQIVEEVPGVFKKVRGPEAQVYRLKPERALEVFERGL
jgi:8-oxo-dGTP diphosphatase